MLAYPLPGIKFLAEIKLRAALALAQKSSSWQKYWLTHRGSNSQKPSLTVSEGLMQRGVKNGE